MDNKKIGSFITLLRKQKSMTQKELADKLNVTSKAVSKWETGQGYPEITTIPMIAEIFGVSISELFNGEFNNSEQVDKPDDSFALAIIDETVQYINHKNSKAKNTAILIITVVLIFISFVCLLCNYLINHEISWSLYPIGALAIVWFMVAPVLVLNKYKSIGLFTGTTITVIPYLFLVQMLTPVKGWVFPLALPIAAISLISFEIVLFMFSYTKINKIYCAAVAVLLYGVIINFWVGKIVDNYLNKFGKTNVPLFTTILGCLFLSIFLFVYGYIRKTRKRDV